MTKNYYCFLLSFFILFLVSATTIAQQKTIYDIARNGTLTELKEATKNNADLINKKNDAGYSALTLACYYGNHEVAKYLIERVKDINAGSDYGTPLMAASVKGDTELVKLLLKKNANVDTPDPNGTTALHYAIIFKFEEIAELLAKANAKSDLKDNRGKTALDYAKLLGNEKIIKLLTSK